MKKSRKLTISNEVEKPALLNVAMMKKAVAMMRAQDVRGVYYDPVSERTYTPPKLDRDSEAFKLMLAAGWTVGEPFFHDPFEAPPGVETYGLASITQSLRVNFTCVCGRQETFMRLLTVGELERSPAFRNGKWDACADIERAGAVSPEHLRQDGFDQSTIDRVLFVYGMRDKIKKLSHANRTLAARVTNLTATELNHLYEDGLLCR